MKKLINYYLEYSKETKRAGTYEYESTIAGYLLLYFNNTDVEDFDLKMMHDYILYLKKATSLSNVSINKCIKLIRNILSFNGINLSWITNYKLLKEQKGRFQILSDNELKLLFNYVSNITCRGNSKHYGLMVYLLYDTGIRQSELLNIKLSDINLTNRCICIRARKSNCDRHVFLSDQMYKKLSKYKPVDNPDDLLFYNHLRGRPFNRSDLKLFYRRVKEATKIKRLHSHMFRHTYATDLIELNVPLFVVQKQLGHASIKTTEIYYHSSIKYQKDEMLKIANQR